MARLVFVIVFAIIIVAFVIVLINVCSNDVPEREVYGTPAPPSPQIISPGPGLMVMWSDRPLTEEELKYINLLLYYYYF